MLQETVTRRPTFPSFPHLPIELQSTIWKFAIDAIEGRIVNIKLRTPSTSIHRDIEPLVGTRGHPAGIQGHHFFSPTPIPTILHICHASRSLALNRWTPSFAAPNTQPSIFFDYDRDTLLFDWDSTDTKAIWQTCAGRERVQLISFNLKAQWDNYLYSNGPGLARILHKLFPALRELIFFGGNLDLLWIQGERLYWNSGPIIKFVTPHYCASDESHYFDVIEDFKEKYSQEGWTCPNIREVDLIYIDEGFLSDRPRFEARFREYKKAILASWETANSSHRLDQAGIPFNQVRDLPRIASTPEEFYFG